MDRGKGWSQVETKCACRAYVVVSEDPRRGINKKKDVFVPAVLKEYQSIIAQAEQSDEVKYVERTGVAVCQRFRKVRCECLKFESIINQIRKRQPTGSSTNDDVNRAALAIYNVEGTVGTMYTFLRGRTVDIGPEFSFMESLTFLRSTHTWNLLLLSQKVSAVTNEARAVLSYHSTRSHNADEYTISTSIPASQSINEERASVPSTQSTEKTTEEIKISIPVGKKRALEHYKQVAALHKGATAIERLAEASAKRTK